MNSHTDHGYTSATAVRERGWHIRHPAQRLAEIGPILGIGCIKFGHKLVEGAWRWGIIII